MHCPHCLTECAESSNFCPNCGRPLTRSAVHLLPPRQVRWEFTELTIPLESLSGLDPEVASRLAQRLGLDKRPLRIVVQDERSLARNQEIAIERLGRLVAEALAPPPPPRHPTRPTRASQHRRLASKTRRGAAKNLRRPPDASEEC